MDKSLETSKELLSGLLQRAILNLAPREKFGLLFSGGVDSLLLALLMKKLKLRFKCYFGFVEGIGAPRDLEFARTAARQLKLEFKAVPAKLEEVPELLQKIVPLLKSNNPVIVGVSLPLFVACEKASADGLKVVFSGTGADELFCGYARFKDSKNIAAEAKKALKQLLRKDLEKLEKIAAANSLELKNPFLEKEMKKFASKLPDEMKVCSGKNKVILRVLAADLGADKELAERKKTAAQYGSNFDKAIEKLAKRDGKKSKTEYLESFLKAKGKIATLFSGGKDSCLALWKMQQQGFEIACLVSILPKEHDSFMYHKPDEKLLRLQAQALGIPLLVRKTKGEKEKELADLKTALDEAKKKFCIQGVVSGALYSNYQRERIQRICDELRLKLFSPLWHKKQEEELQELADCGFVFVFTKIAALGLDESWLGKPIGKKEIEMLEKLNERIGLNVVGEGGEFESLVLEAPNFKKGIRIVAAEKSMQNEFTGVLDIKKAVLG